ncbi:MAG: radical SAM family heme chaperone HemW [Fastidiosipilaceae bacterium]
MTYPSPDAAYIHLPFCLRKCGYCDFVSFSGEERRIEAYIKALQTEISRVLKATAESPRREKGGLRPLRSVYFGGGTPNVVPANYLIAILNGLKQYPGVTEDAEITVEANPAAACDEWLKQLRMAGFNRLSIGLQAAQPKLLRFLGRLHSCEEFVRFVRAAKSWGWSDISGDIMLGLPDQSVADVLETLDVMLNEGVPHISFYSLIIEPDTPFWTLFASPAGQKMLPDDETERALYHAAARHLERHGLRQYEISNAAQPGFESRHNLTYWNAASYYGFGCGAHSYIDGVRYSNTNDLLRYLDYYIDRGLSKDETREGEIERSIDRVVEEIIDRREAMKEFFLLGLRIRTGVGRAEFQERFGVPVPPDLGAELRRLCAAGLLEHQADRYFLTDLGMDLANQVFMSFI